MKHPLRITPHVCLAAETYESIRSASKSLSDVFKDAGYYSVAVVVGRNLRQRTLQTRTEVKIRFISSANETIYQCRP